MMPRGAWVVVAVVLAVLATASCARPPYPAPPAHALTATEAPRPRPRDDGGEPRIRELERQCRTRLSGDTAEAALAALDRVREVLGAGCDIETVAHDPLHWRLRCRSDALFASGQYQLARKQAPCAELNGARVQPWACVGAVLRGLVDGEEAGPPAGAIGGPAGGGTEAGSGDEPRGGGDESRGRGVALAMLQLAVMGHVDYQLLKPGSNSHVCTDLHAAFGFTPPGRWARVAEDAPDEERLYANNQLAWCRAASVTEQVRAGMLGGDALKQGPASPAAPATDATDATPTPAGVVATTAPTRTPERTEFAVIGMATSWLASQKDGRCPSHGKPASERPDCADARRVDVLMRFSPRAETRRSTCARTEAGTEAALWCLEDCMERLALGGSAGAGVAPQAAPLFVDGKDERATLPVGWYVQRAPATETRRLALGRVCEVLGVRDPAAGNP